MVGALPLAVTDMGETPGTDSPPVIVLHGLFGRRRNWQGIQKRLAQKTRIVTADMRNHGDSPWSDDMTYEAMAADIAHLIRDLGAGPALVVGHSMGGKAAMTLALTEPDALKAAMVIDVAPVPYDHSYDDYIAAMRSIPLDRLNRRSEADIYLQDAVPDPAVRAFLLQNLGQDDEGLRWQVNLDAIDRHMPDILDFPVTGGTSYDGPMRFLAGGASDYIKDRDWDAIEGLFPWATLERIDGAGHWVNADKPAETIAAIEAFIDAA